MSSQAIFIFLLVLLMATPGCSMARKSKPDYDVDVCVYGGTSAGVIAAYKIKMSGKTVLLIEPGRNLGGLSSGGLGATDIGDENALNGLARDYYMRLGKKYGLNDVAWHFEPKVAEEVFNDYIREAEIDVLFDYSITCVEKENSAIKKLKLHDYEYGKPDVTIAAKIFIDCSYEGDLMALSGVSYTIGRESNIQYNEAWNGVTIVA